MRKYAPVDPIVILWLGWGLDGAAIGLVMFRIVMMGLGLYFAVVQHDLIARPQAAEIKAFLKPYMAVAVPAIATQMATPAGNYLLTIVMAPFGDDAVAAWAVVGRLTVVAFGGIFALSGAIGGIFGQNYGAGLYDRLRSTYRDAVVFCLIYTFATWGLIILATPAVISLFGASSQGADVIWAFSTVGVGGFVFVGALFVSNAAFNNLGTPARSTILNWVKEGLLSWPCAVLLAASFGAPGVIYGQAVASALIGAVACIWGWRFVNGLDQTATRGLDQTRPRPYPNPDRYRRR